MKQFYTAHFADPQYPDDSKRATVESGGFGNFHKQGVIAFWVYREDGKYKLAKGPMDPKGVNKYYITQAMINQEWQ